MSNNISLRQPYSLRFLFLTEMWERFSYYAVQSLLVLYMTKALLFSDTKSYLIYAGFNSLLLASPVIGGFIADRILGYMQAVNLGALFLIIGYFLLIFHSESFMYFGFTLLTLGNGFLKPNISTLLGTFYKDNDPRCQRGYTIFYVGINVGGVVGTVAGGFIASYISWDATFVCASLAMILGMIVFNFGSAHIRYDKKQSGKTYYADQAQGKNQTLFYTLLLVGIYPLYCLMKSPNSITFSIIVFAAILLSFLGFYCFHYQGLVRRKLMVCIALIIFSIAFWALYQEAPMALTLYIARDVNLNLFGLTLPPSVLWALSPFFIVTLAPLIIKLWKKLEQRQMEPSIPLKFAWGIFFMGIGYYVLAISAHGVIVSHERSSLGWIVASYALQTFGELCLSPVGLAMISILAPERLRGMLMGTWFFALAAATVIAGRLALIASVPKDLQDSIASAKIYHHAFMIYGDITVAVGLVLFILVPVMKAYLKPRASDDKTLASY